MSKLPRRYNDLEFANLVVCIKPYERWTATERRAWAADCYGFRHFTAANITPIEHYRPKARDNSHLLAGTRPARKQV